MTIDKMKTCIQSCTDSILAAMPSLEEYMDDAEHGKVRLKDLAEDFFHLKTLYAELDKAATAISSNLERINKGILPKKLQEQDLDMIRVPDIGRSFSLRTNYSASMIDREAAMEWLRTTGNEALIQETVNAGTLASFCRNMILNEGTEPPADLIKVSTYDSISIVKYTPKPGKGGGDE